MRILLLMRGAPGCGKTTFIEKNGFSQYSLSADNIRSMLGYEFESDYKVCASAMESRVWDYLHEMLEIRMKDGMFTVIDACNSRPAEVQQYKHLAEKYRYRVYCVDFTDIPIEQCLKQNKERPKWKQVPESSIRKNYSRFNQPLPNYITMLKRDELDKLIIPPNDYSDKYENIKIFGDIHGCYTALSEALNGELDNDTLYIFTGDYLDRGIENKETLEWFLNNYKRKNVVCLEGNHEIYLWYYSNGTGFENLTPETTLKQLNKFKERNQRRSAVEAVFTNKQLGYSNSFKNLTVPQIEGIAKKEIRQFYRSLWQCAYFVFHGQKYLVTHGGISNFPKDGRLYLKSARQMIKGTGEFEDSDEIEQEFEFSAPDIIQVHGHRNILRSPVKISDRTYNLEGEVEFGGCLRYITLKSDGSIETHEISNGVFDHKFCGQDKDTDKARVNVHTLIESFRKSPALIREKAEGDISSFNFTRTAFIEKNWNDITVKARGLFINTVTEKIVARSYDKFFNVGEVNATRIAKLASDIKFPVQAFIKENGFLGILGYDENKDDFIIASKSTTTGNFAGYFRKLLFNSGADMSAVKSYMSKNNCSFIFEVIDIENDTHIIEYSNSHIVLLDIIKNSLEFDKLPYDELTEKAKEFGFQVKKLGKTIYNTKELKDIISVDDYRDMDDKILSGSGRYDDGYFEGYVFEDAGGFMFKYKNPYYKHWKMIRGIIPSVIKYGMTPRTGMLCTAASNEFYQWLCKQPTAGSGLNINSQPETKEEKELLNNCKIVPLRREWYRSKQQRKN